MKEIRILKINLELEKEDYKILEKYGYVYERNIKEVAERQCKEVAQALREAEFIKK